jgi:hypothetical protein
MQPQALRPAKSATKPAHSGQIRSRPVAFRVWPAKHLFPGQYYESIGVKSGGRPVEKL